jgi:hypothetical protein
MISASASSQDKSVKRSGSLVTYGPANVLDGDYSSAWVEGKKGIGIGEWIELRFDKPLKVVELHVWNGYQKYVSDNLGDRFYVNERVEQAELQTASGSRTIRLDDSKTKQVVLLDGTATTWIRLTVKSVYGAEYKDCAISEMQVVAAP